MIFLHSHCNIVKQEKTERMRQKKKKKIEEIMAKLSSICYQQQYTNLKIHEAQQIPNRINTKKATSRHAVKLLKTKNKQKILKTTR